MPTAKDDRTAQEPAQGQGPGRLGALDSWPALSRQRLRCRHRLARLVPPSLDRARPGRQPLVDARGSAAPRAGSRRLVGPHHRGGPTGRGDGRTPRPGASRSFRAQRRRPGDLLLRRGPADASDPRQADRRRDPRQGSRRHSDRPAPARPDATPEAAQARAQSLARDQDARPPKAHRPGAEPLAPSAEAAGNLLGRAVRGAGKGDVQGGLATPVAARVRGRGHRGRRLGQYRRGRRECPGPRPGRPRRDAARLDETARRRDPGRASRDRSTYHGAGPGRGGPGQRRHPPDGRLTSAGRCPPLRQRPPDRHRDHRPRGQRAGGPDRRRLARRLLLTQRPGRRGDVRQAAARRRGDQPDPESRAPGRVARAP